jgi:hypothetical protein
MGKTLLFLMLLSVKLTFGQFKDSFDDGDFTSNPSWIGNTALFNVNAAKQLQTRLATVAQTVSLATASQLMVNAKWEFFVQLNFDPSATNQVKIYLTSDQQDLNGPLNGYFLQIGESGNTDSYDLYRQTGTTITKIIDGPAKSRSNTNQLLANIKVTRTEQGNWELYTDITGGTNFTLEGSTTDLAVVAGDWFGVNCKYTATRSDGFIFDNFNVSELVPDVTPPTLLSANAVSELSVDAVFSERLEGSSALMANNYLLEPLGQPSSVAATNLPNVYRLGFASALPTGDYKLTVTNVKDVKGNLINGNNKATFFYLKPYTLKKDDILVSELLFNPKVGGVDFVEIYNNSNQIIDLKDMQLANIDANGNVANIKTLSAAPVYMPAKSYWVLSTSSSIVMQQYNVKFPKQLLQLTSLPSFNNDKGTVILLSGQTVLDRLDYTEKMHHDLLRDPDGVSLERVSFKVNANAAGNFKSAAMSEGFATPTYRNSQELYDGLLQNKVTLASKTFSPDGDGFEDLLQINYQLMQNGAMATINIYSDKGMLIKKLQRNTTIATEGSFAWDGLNETGQLSNVGIYIVKFDVFALDGTVENFKQTCVLAKRLN